MPTVAPTSRLVTATFTRDDTPDDPDDVAATYQHEGDDAVEATPYNPDVGVYRFEIDCLEGGWYTARVTGTWDDAPNGPTYKTFEERWYVAHSQIAESGS